MTKHPAALLLWVLPPPFLILSELYSEVLTYTAMLQKTLYELKFFVTPPFFFYERLILMWATVDLFLFLSQKNPEAPSSKKHSCANICVSLLYYNPSHQPYSVPLLMQQQLKSWLLQRRKKKTWRKSAETSLQNGLWHKKVVTLDHFRAFLFAHHLVTSKRPNSSKKRPSSMWVLWQLSDQWT